MPSGQDGNVESVAAEVNRVVDLVFEHAAHRPNSSLAVVTASAQHAARVGEAIRLQMANHADSKEFFSGGEEPFRVVPVDRAGGLVRDHVIFSLGYGRTPHGRAMHHFGPLSEPGGRRRFALAMSRARHTMHVLTCFQPGELDESRLSEGALDFHELLERELAGRTELGTRATRAAASGESLGADPLVTDLGERLASRGARVWHHYDGEIDMAAAVDPLLTLSRDDQEQSVPVAVESDGTNRYRELSVRERSRQRPELLERMGWRYFTLWTIEVFTDPGSCADMIADLLGLDGQSDEGNGTGFLAGGVMGSALRSEATQAWGVQGRPDGEAPGSVWNDMVLGESGAEDTAPRDAAAYDDVIPLDDYREGSPVAARDHLSSHRRVTAPSTDSADEESQRTPGSEDAEGAEESHEPPQGGEEAPGEAGEPPSQPMSRREVRGSEGPGRRRSSDEPVLPRRAAEDDPRAWGDRESDRNHDQWLKDQRPPHWG
jgi:hypothetical protein